MISTQTCQVFIQSLLVHDLSPKQLIEGLSVTWEQFTDPDYKLSPEDYHTICDRYAELIQTGNNQKKNKSSHPLDSYLSTINLTQLLADTMVMVTVMDLNGKIYFSNRPPWSTPEHSIIGKSIFEFLDVSQHDDIRTSLKKVSKTGEMVLSERLVHYPGIPPLWLENRTRPIQHHGKVIGAISVSLDVTERRKYEREIAKRALQLKAVAEVNTQLKSVWEVTQLVKHVCDLTKDRFGLYHVHFYVLDSDHEQLVIEAGSGEIGQKIVETKRTFQLGKNEKGLVATAARERKACLSNDVLKDKRFLYNPFLPDTRSELAIPVILGDQLKGILDIQSEQLDFFSPNDVEVMQVLADQIAIALHNAQLYSDMLRQWDIANTFRDIGMVMTSEWELRVMLRNIMQEVGRVIPYTAGAIWLFDSAKQSQVMASYGYEEFEIEPNVISKKYHDLIVPNMQKVLDTGKLVVVNDTNDDDAWVVFEGFEWVRSWVGVPLTIRGDVVGMLSLDHREPNFYHRSYESTLDLLARQIALAVENALLFEKEREQREMAETLRDIGAVLTSQLEQADILQLVLAQVARVLPYEAAAIWLDNGRGIFEVAAQFGYDRFAAEGALRRLTFERAERWLTLNEGAIVVSETGKDSTWKTYPDFEWVKSWATVPIRVHDQIIGQLSLDHTEANFYQHHHLGILEVLATQISIAVGNARLFDAERRRRQEIEALQRGNMSLSSSLELQEVLDAILGATLELVPVHSAHIFLFENSRLRFGAGIDENHQRLAFPIVDPRPNGMTYQVALSGESMIVEDIHRHPLFRNLMHPWFQTFDAIMAIALKFREQVVGVMNLSFASPQDLQQVEISSLQFLSNQASIAIENARLYAAVQDYAASLETRVAERTEELVQERAQLQAILDGMGEGVIYDQRLEVKYVNQMLMKMTGCNFDHVRTLPEMFMRLFAESVDTDELMQTMFQSVDTNGVWEGEVMMKRCDGTEFTTKVYMTAVFDAEGHLNGVATLIRDISQEKVLQAQKDRFISNASHELRTPITNIQTRLYLLKKRPEKTAEHLQVIEMVTEQMAQLIRELLDLSRFERGGIKLDRTFLALQPVVSQVVEVQRPEADKKSIQLNTQLPAESIETAVDRMRLVQVLTNLVMNAISYTPDGGKVDVILNEVTDEMVEIQVQDTGVGISPAALEQIFQPFFRAREGMAIGTGLGLSISQEIVQAHGGTLTVESVENEGSTFTIRLPRATSDELEASA